MDAGYRLLPLGAANNYLEDCLRRNDSPSPRLLLEAILP